MPRLVDTHAHVQFPVYQADRAAVIGRALDAGIWMVNIGTQAATSADAILLAEKYDEGVYASVGFHPGHIANDFHDAMEEEKKRAETFDAASLRKLAAHPKVVGIGECGLDYFRIENPESGIKEQQKEIFISHIGLAKEFKKPLVIHCREAFTDLVKILTSNSQLLTARPPGVIHFFSGAIEDAEKLIDLGFYLGFGGVVTFAKNYESLIKAIPLDRIVLETDAPYVSPVPYRGKRNEPLYVEAVASKIAEWKGVSFDELASATTVNARTVYQIL